MILIFPSLFAGCWGSIQCGGMYFLAISAIRGPGMGFSPTLHFLLGQEGHISLSWCLGGELGARVSAIVGFLWVRLVRVSSHWMWS